MVKKVELLAPAGDREKLETALHFGADAVYFAGKNYGLRAFADNFTDGELKEMVNYVHSLGKKTYITLNVFARNNDFNGLADYLKVLEEAKIDACIVSDLGMFMFIKEHAPNLVLHVSTQANTTNKFSANAWAKLGARRVILARELSLEEVAEITKNLPKDVETETFVHGAMCISYSGRCLLSNYLTGRDSNHGECVQACRWHYSLTEGERPNEKFDIEEDARGAYILNSKDMCLIEYLDQLKNVNISSFKVEGRMKSPYYVATIINAYRRALDYLYDCEKQNKPFVCPSILKAELNKASHRKYTTGFMINDEKIRQNYESASQEQECIFIAKVIKTENGRVLVEHRNRFSVGDELEVLSPDSNFNKVLKIIEIEDSKGHKVETAKLVQEQVYVTFNENVNLNYGDILRSKSLN